MRLWGREQGEARARLLAHLQTRPLDYRQALAVLDPDYREWRPGGKPKHSLLFFGDLALLLLKRQRVCLPLGAPTPEGTAQAAAWLGKQRLNEVYVLGEEMFAALRPLLGQGKWRRSPNYGLDEEHFRPRRTPRVRPLSRLERREVEEACAHLEGFPDPRSVLRDFRLMAKGRPITCSGAYTRQQLVGFCSSAPICQGVTEIGTLGVAAGHRGEGLGAGLVTAQAFLAFERKDLLAYHNRAASDGVDTLVRSLGFWEVTPAYHFIPATSREQWRAGWGRPA